MLFLHALPLDGSMWAAQAHLLPGSTYAPTLYPFGDRIETWAEAALALVRQDRFIAVGCSVGGSCALELAALAPERIAALVLIGTKARHWPDPALQGRVLRTLRAEGLEAAWEAFWAPLFSAAADGKAIAEGRRITLRQSLRDVARGVTAFHTRPTRDRVLPAFPCPVAVVTGANDIAPGLKVSRMQAESAPRGRLYVVPDCGHYVPLEQPDHLNAILREVIAACGAPIVAA
ncbi:MAG TPA: alpha/beta hydrolase [Reyranella sp.]|nr:alpha/beta hydrolase [Reyranella sp.]